MKPTAEPASAGRPLSAEEAAELGHQIAELAKAGLPLGAGLRAMAAELPSRRLAQALRRVAAQVDAGVELPAALSAKGVPLPPHVLGLVLAGVRSGRLPELMEQFVAAERRRLELRRRVRLAVAYPGLLLAALFALYLSFSEYVVPGFTELFGEFGAALPTMTHFTLWIAGPGSRALVALLVLVVTGFVLLASARHSPAARRALDCFPVLGPMWRARRLAVFSRLMSLLLDQQVPLPEALRLSGEGVNEPVLADACREAARRVEGGDLLSDSLSDSRQYPPSLRPVVHWGQHVGDLAGAFRGAAELYERRVQTQLTLWEAVVPPILFLLVGSGILLMVLGLFLPLVGLIVSLT